MSSKTKLAKARADNLYWVRRDSIDTGAMRDIVAGKMDGMPLGIEAFESLMETLTAARCAFFRLELGSYNSADCIAVRTAMQSAPISLVMMAIKGAAYDPYWRERVPSLAQITRQMGRLVELAQAQPRRTLSRDEAMARYLDVRVRYELSNPWEAREEPAIDSRRTPAEIMAEVSRMEAAMIKALP